MFTGRQDWPSSCSITAAPRWDPQHFIFPRGWSSASVLLAAFLPGSSFVAPLDAGQGWGNTAGHFRLLFSLVVVESHSATLPLHRLLPYSLLSLLCLSLCLPQSWLLPLTPSPPSLAVSSTPLFTSPHLSPFSEEGPMPFSVLCLQSPISSFFLVTEDFTVCISPPQTHPHLPIQACCQPCKGLFSSSLLFTSPIKKILPFSLTLYI